MVVILGAIGVGMSMVIYLIFPGCRRVIITKLGCRVRASASAKALRFAPSLAGWLREIWGSWDVP